MSSQSTSIEYNIEVCSAWKKALYVTILSVCLRTAGVGGPRGRNGAGFRTPNH